MKCDKIIKETVNLLLKDNYKICYSELENNVALIHNNIAIFLVPKNKFFLDLEKTECKRLEPIAIKRMFEITANHKEAKLTNQSLDIGKGTAKLIMNDDTKCYVNNQYLKYFDKKDEVKFYITKSNQPVLCVVDDLPVAVILPINVRE